MSDEEGSWWDGETWVYFADVENDGVNSGNHQYQVIIPVGSEMQVLYGMFKNTDTAARTLTIEIYDASATYLLARIISSSLNAGALSAFPYLGAVFGAGGNNLHQPQRLIISGGMVLHIKLASIAVSEGSQLSLVCRIRGAKPVVTITSPTDAVETVRVNETN